MCDKETNHDASNCKAESPLGLSECNYREIESVADSNSATIHEKGKSCDMRMRMSVKMTNDDQKLQE